MVSKERNEQFWSQSTSQASKGTFAVTLPACLVQVTPTGSLQSCKAWPQCYGNLSSKMLASTVASREFLMMNGPLSSQLLLSWGLMYDLCQSLAKADTLPRLALT